MCAKPDFAVLMGFFALSVYLVFPTFQHVGYTLNGYAAKRACSIHFVAKRPNVRSQPELAGVFQIPSMVIDDDSQTVSTSFMGFYSRVAKYRAGFGCALTDKHTGSLNIPDVRAPAVQVGQGVWPIGNDVQKSSVLDLEMDVRMKVLHKAVEEAFTEDSDLGRKETRAVVVLFRGQPIIERYGEGYTNESLLEGWSMTKSIINALYGVREQQGKVSVRTDTLSHPSWINGDIEVPQNITLLDALHMSSGLRFDEDYHPFIPKDPSIMLFSEPDTAQYAAERGSRMAPGQFFSYASGTTNLLSRALRDTFDSYEEYAEFPRKSLFNEIGADSFIMETDSAGTFVGSSFSWATARDWARFGLLYMQDGIWNGKRLLPEWWVKATRKPCSSCRDQYSMHFWFAGHCQPVDDGVRPRHTVYTNRRMPSLPCDTFLASGYEGQTVAIIPSRELVIVRLGCTKHRELADELTERLLFGVVDSMPHVNDGYEKGSLPDSFPRKKRIGSNA